MSKRRLIPTIVLTICLLFSSVFAISISTGTKSASADTPVTNTYNSGTDLAYQGQNNFFFAYGRKTNYVLMEYLVWSTRKYWKNPFENYATITGTSIHPGYVLDSIVIWVADRSGTISVEATLKRGNVTGDGNGGNQDDGNSFGVYHQKATSVDTLLEDMVHDKTGLTYSGSLEVTKGDCILLTCGSGPSHNNVNDQGYYVFNVTYTSNGDDFVASETGAALAKFLKISTPGAINGYKHIEQDFAADNLCAEELIDSDETTIIIRNSSNVSSSDSSCSSSLTSLLPIGIISIIIAGAFLVIKKVKRSEG